MSNISVSIDTDQVKSQTDVAVLCRNAEIFSIIQHQAEYEDVALILKSVKSRYSELDKQRKEITKPIDEAKKNVMELFRTPLVLLEKAENTLKRLMIDYTTRKEKEAKEEQLRLQKIAEKAAEDEKKKLEAKIERAKASGKEEKAELLEEQKENIVPVSVPVIAPQIETPKGVSYKDNWTAVITDPNLVPREWCVPDEKALNAFAKSTKGTKQVPGVEFKCEKIISSRGL